MSAGKRVTTRGVVFIHSTPTALCPHITWALESVLGQSVTLDWTEQQLGRSLKRAEFSWTGEPGTGAKLASAMRGWDNVRSVSYTHLTLLSLIHI